LSTEAANQNGTRERLLEAAGEVFAQHGFHATTVREICRRAGSNVAAVNYHFGNKQRLYRAVIEYAHRFALEKHPPDRGLSPQASAEERLKAFVHSLLLRLFDEGRPAWHGRLMAREMIEPTDALDYLVPQVIKPLHELVVAIVQEILGRTASPERTRRCVTSVVAQCMHLFHARPVLNRLTPQQNHESGEVDRWAEHIARFSLAGIRRIGEEDGTAA